MVRFLVENGADVNCPGHHGPFESFSYPLLEAIEFGHEDMVAYLLERGADANVNDNGRMPLQDALRGGHRRIIKLLNDAGASTSPPGSVI